MIRPQSLEEKAGKTSDQYDELVPVKESLDLVPPVLRLPLRNDSVGVGVRLSRRIGRPEE